ncbi:MAG: hypothetical protein ACREFW_00855 [Rhizomicrobium sp.]
MAGVKLAAMAATWFMMAVGAAQAAPICLSTRDMLDTKPNKDGSALFFTMRDGSMWRNDLHGRCPDLNFDTGFVWTILNPDYTVCENEQALTVRPSGETCLLGKFTQIRPSRAERHAGR